MTRIICVFLLSLFSTSTSFAAERIFTDRFDCKEAVVNDYAEVYEPADRTQAGKNTVGGAIALEVTSREACVRMQVARSLATSSDQTAWVYLPKGSRIRTNGAAMWDDRCGNSVKEIYYFDHSRGTVRYADVESESEVEYLDIRPEETRVERRPISDRRPIYIQTVHYPERQPAPQPVYYRERSSGGNMLGYIAAGAVGYLIGNRTGRRPDNHYYGNCSFSQNCGNTMSYQPNDYGRGRYGGGYRPHYPRPNYPSYPPYSDQPRYTPPPNPIYNNPLPPTYSGPTGPGVGPGNPTLPPPGYAPPGNPIYNPPPGPGG